MDLFFDSDIVSLLKTKGGRDRRPNYVIIVVWSAKVSSLVFLVLFKDGTQAESRVLSLGGLRSKRCCGHKEVGML